MFNVYNNVCNNVFEPLNSVDPGQSAQRALLVIEHFLVIV